MTTPTYGIWLLFGLVLAPFYLTLAGWFFGRPREWRMPLLGIGLLLGFAVVAWGGMALFAALLGALFY